MCIYEYRCDDCGKITEILAHMNDDHTPPKCECGAQTKRIWNSASIGDEFKSVKLAAPGGHVVKAHGDHFNIALGEYVRGKQHFKELCAKHGVRPAPGQREV